MRFRLGGLILVASAALSACQLLASIGSVDLVPSEDGGGPRDAAPDMRAPVEGSPPRPDTGHDAPDAACGEAGAVCDGACVNETIDEMNCGACGAACPGAMKCSSGACLQTFEAGIEQPWTVPLSSTYVIEAVGGFGGAGGGPDAGSAGGPGGLGADVVGRFALAHGATLSILVGAAGALGYEYSGGPGGGGSFVVAGSAPVIVAGGGGGGAGFHCDGGAGSPASLTGAGTAGAGGGVGGSGGHGGMGSEGGGGGGLLSDGTMCATEGGGGVSFENGGAGASCDLQVSGGFGGGGGGDYCGGGGGGYSGGGGGGTGGGGGGGSFVAADASDTSITLASTPGDGRVSITLVR